MAWSVSAFFLGIAGALFGNMTGFIEPLETAYPTLTFGIFMVAMTLLGGKGTLWGPIIGATLFYTLRELTWTYLLGWQYIALGVLIIVNVVYFQQGVMGWLKARSPQWFGVQVEDAIRASPPRRGRRGGEGMSDPIIEVRGVTKAFGGVVANHNVSLKVRARRNHRPDRPERLGQDDAVQFDRRPAPDRLAGRSASKAGRSRA